MYFSFVFFSNKYRILFASKLLYHKKYTISAFRNTGNVLTRFLQISTRSFINFDVNKRRNKLDSILLALFCKKVRCTDRLIHFFHVPHMISNFVISLMRKETKNYFISFTLVQLHKHFVHCIIKVLSELIWASSFSFFLELEMLSPA